MKRTHNKAFQRIYGMIEENANFFKKEEKDMRLLSKEEVENYKEELDISIIDIVSLIDLFDNDFIVYDIKNDCFKKLNIVDETFFHKIDNEEIMQFVNAIVSCRI